MKKRTMLKFSECIAFGYGAGFTFGKYVNLRQKKARLIKRANITLGEII